MLRFQGQQPQLRRGKSGIALSPLKAAALGFKWSLMRTVLSSSLNIGSIFWPSAGENQAEGKCRFYTAGPQYTVCFPKALGSTMCRPQPSTCASWEGNLQLHKDFASKLPLLAVEKQHGEVAAEVSECWITVGTPAPPHRAGCDQRCCGYGTGVQAPQAYVGPH